METCNTHSFASYLNRQVFPVLGFFNLFAIVAIFSEAVNGIGRKLLVLVLAVAVSFAMYAFGRWMWRLTSRFAISRRCRAVDTAADDARRSRAVYELALRATAVPFLHNVALQKIQTTGENPAASDDFRGFCSEALAQLKATQQATDLPPTPTSHGSP